MGVIGILAALTVPTLVKNYKNTQTVTQLKKTYSMFSQAIKMAEADYGTPDTWNYGSLDFNDTEANAFAETYLYPYLKVIKRCKSDTHKCTNQERQSMSGRTNYSAYYPSYATWSTTELALLADGTLVWVYLYNPSDHFLGIGFDINGDKAPNTVGKDIFYLVLANTSPTLNLQGAPDLSNYQLITSIAEGCNKKAGNVAGRYCGALIQRLGWKIPTKSEYINLGGDADQL